MEHLNLSLPTGIAPGDVRTAEQDVEVVRLNGGNEVRNQQWEEQVRGFEVSYPPMKKTDANFIAVMDLWAATEFGAFTFNHEDPLTGETVRVRFDSKFSATHVAGPYYRIDTISLVEVARD